MSVGEIAGLIAAIAAVALVAFCAVPLLKLGRVLEELRLAVRDVGHSSVPILHELKGTVTATNTELGKLSVFRNPGKEDLVVVTFEQDYRSNNLSNVLKKRQYWQKEGRHWKIVYEGFA